MNYYSQSQTICSNQLSWSYIIFYKNQLLRFKISENIIYLYNWIIPYPLSCMVNIFVSKCSNSIPNIKPFVHFTTRPRTDVVKKGWYLGKRAKGIDIGLQGACKGEIRNLTIPLHLMFGIEKDCEFIASGFNSRLCSTCTIHASND